MPFIPSSIEQTLKKLEVTDEKLYDLFEIYTIIVDTGLFPDYQEYNTWRCGFWYYQVKLGNIVVRDYPKIGRNKKFMLSGKELKVFLKAFAPGGNRKFNYKELDATNSHQDQGVSVQEEGVPSDSNQQDHDLTASPLQAEQESPLRHTFVQIEA